MFGLVLGIQWSLILSILSSCKSLNCPLPDAYRGFSDSSVSLWVVSEPSVGRMDGRGLVICLLSASIHLICGREAAAPGTQSETAASQQEGPEMGTPGEERALLTSRTTPLEHGHRRTTG